MTKKLIATWKWLDPHDKSTPFYIECFSSRKDLEENCFFSHHYYLENCTTSLPFNIIEVNESNHSVTDTFNLTIERN